MKYFIVVDLFKKAPDGTDDDLLRILKNKRFLNNTYDVLVFLTPGLSSNNTVFIEELANKASTLGIKTTNTAESSLKNLVPGPLDTLLIVSDTEEFGARKLFYKNSHYIPADRILFFLV